MKRRRFAKYDAYKRSALKYSEYYVLLLVVLLLLFRFVIGISRVSGDSMYPTLKNKSIVVYTRINDGYEIGDIVSLKMAYGEYYIKRVVALPGDVVDIQNGQLIVNGIPEEGIACGETHHQESLMSYPYTVPEGRMFVLGDNREASIDSRTFGPVADSQIRGKIVFDIG